MLWLFYLKINKQNKTVIIWNFRIAGEADMAVPCFIPGPITSSTEVSNR